MTPLLILMVQAQMLMFLCVLTNPSWQLNLIVIYYFLISYILSIYHRIQSVCYTLRFAPLVFAIAYDCPMHILTHSKHIQPHNTHDHITKCNSSHTSNSREKPNTFQHFPTKGKTFTKLQIKDQGLAKTESIFPAENFL